jgi:hypothetical protein
MPIRLECNEFSSCVEELARERQICVNERIKHFVLFNY